MFVKSMISDVKGFHLHIEFLHCPFESFVFMKT